MGEGDTSRQARDSSGRLGHLTDADRRKTGKMAARGISRPATGPKTGRGTMNIRVSLLAAALAALMAGPAAAAPVKAIGKLKNPQQFTVHVTRHCNLDVGILSGLPTACPASDFAQIGARCTCTVKGEVIYGVVGR
jgi:hypothetical protein